MTESSKDKRYFPRVTISMDGCIKDSDRRAVLKTIDLTVEGISFEFEEILPLGTQIIISLDGNQDVRNNDLKAEILRCDLIKNTSPTQYVVAAKFIDANDEYLMDCLALVHGKNKKSK